MFAPLHLLRTVPRWVGAAALFGLLSCDRPTTAPVAPPSNAASRDVVSGGDNVVLTWDAAILQAIRTTRPGPPMVARSLAVVHTAIFDAWAAYDATAVGTRLGGSLRRPAAERTGANKRAAVSYAAYRTLVDLFPAVASSFDAVMRQLGYDPADRSTDVATAIGIGNVAAQAVIDFRHHDGANQLGDLNPGAYSDYTGYKPVNSPDVISDPNRWQPLRIGNKVQTFVGPQWGLVIPFSLTSGRQFRPSVLPNEYPFGGFEKEVEQTIKYSASLTDETKMIAEYWADGPNSELPPGHWCLFGAAVSRRDNHSVDDDVKMFFALGNALFDGSIVAWDAKRYFDSVRPVTAVHFWKAGKMIRAWGGPYKGVVPMRGELWQPYQLASVVTPPFPEFISGHSIFSSAGAEILERFTGSAAFGGSVTLPAGSSRVEPGLVPARDVTLSWPTFRDAADQAGLSRRYGGIHFAQGDVQSRAIGKLLGAQVWAKAQSYFDGTAR
jgi:hypothetical protein